MMLFLQKYKRIKIICTLTFTQKLTEDTQERRLSNKGSISKLQFHNKDDDLILTLGKKEFSYYEHQNVFVQNSGQWVSNSLFELYVV